MIWFYTLISVIIISLISLIGVFSLSFEIEKIKKVSLLLVSFAVGGLFGDAIIHLLPETFKEMGFGLLPSLLILSGILLFFVLERFLRWQHCHEIDCPDHRKDVANIILIGDAVHNMIDGMIIAASFLTNIPLGLATTIAVIFHEIPSEIGEFGVLIHSGFSAKKALLFNFLSGLTAILGAIIVLVLGPRINDFSLFLLPITAGGFLYIAGSDLLPELHHDVKLSTSLWQMILIILGISIMASLVLLG
ncbi:MAG: ZIP family metal transporter [Parcubacteria group bacterium CG10_big_fil_rev_8_21_14_0_10_35_15]|nr:MAG: ZIP family metal transporter [Parcubacteria group bacterium CG10_big_fil_rev_8_21_14_0_10_35_15]